MTYDLSERWPHSNGTMAPFDRKYSPTRMKAIYRARFELGLSYPEIAKKAQAGEIVAGDPFEIGAYYVGECCRKEEKRRALRFTSPLADKPHRDAIEELRRGLIAAADDMLTELRGRKPANVDPERARQIARLVREASAIPIPKADIPAKPGEHRDGQREGGITRHGQAGSLLAAHRGNRSNDHANDAAEANTHDQAGQAGQTQEHGQEQAQQLEAQGGGLGSHSPTESTPLAA
jgi:hypothetical protein